MLKNEDINKIFNIKESYQIVEALESILFDKEKREKVFNEVLSLGVDLNVDFLRDFFQQEHGDRNRLKQDYTPDCLAKLVGKLEDGEVIADLCAGTGSLTINKWTSNKNASYHCYEYAIRSYVVLLFNLVIRNIKGEAWQCDLLTGEKLRGYKLIQGEQFSDLIPIEEEEEEEVDLIIANPPYSMKWNEVDNYKTDERFKYGIPPKDKSDFAFILTGLQMLKQGGTLIAILPHGVLFRGNREGIIRENLIKHNIIDSVIGVPDKLFLNTSIPVFILVLKKNKQNNNILFIDASKNFKKLGAQNLLEDETITKIVNTYQLRATIDKWSYTAYSTELKYNNYNLNIPRYIDNYEPEPIPNIKETFTDLIKLYGEQEKIEKQIAKSMGELVYNGSGDQEEEWETARKMFSDYNEHKEVKLIDIAKVERAIKGKIYPKGTILIQLSASANTMHPRYLFEDSEVDSKYACCVVNEEYNTYYIYQLLDFNYLEFKAKYQTDINTQFDTLKYIKLEVHTNREKQDKIATELYLRELEIQRQQETLGFWKNIKTYFLNKLFPDDNGNSKIYEPEPMQEVAVAEEPKPKKEQTKIRNLFNLDDY